MSVEFLITALIVVLTPGTGVVYTVATGLSRGKVASVAAAFGCTFGILPAMAAAAVGLAAVMHASAVLFLAVKILGVAYLLFIAWQTLKESGPLVFGDQAPSDRGLLGIVRTGCLINVLNPKLSAFFLAFLPQFVDPGAGSTTMQIGVLGAMFMAMTFVVFIGYGVFAAVTGERVLRSPVVLKWMRRTVALAFAGFGLRLALAER